MIGAHRYLRLRSAFRLIRHELRDDTGLPLRRKLALWRRGFYAESAELYDLARNDPRDYLSDFVQATECREINAQNELFAHKLMLRSFLLAMGYPQPETVAFIHEGRIHVDPFGEAAVADPGELRRRRTARAAIVSCWSSRMAARSGGGRAARCSRSIWRLFSRSWRDTPGRRTSPWWRRLQQGAFWAALFPDSANTIRALTRWTPGEPAPFLARAVQRLGTRNTVPTDNWSGGGISAPIAGATLPYWPAIRATVLRAAASLPFNRMAGWDVLVDPSGTPVILETNGNSDVNLLQVHGGLLRDFRIRRFYQACGVV